MIVIRARQPTPPTAASIVQPRFFMNARLADAEGVVAVCTHENASVRCVGFLGMAQFERASRLSAQNARLTDEVWDNPWSNHRKRQLNERRLLRAPADHSNDLYCGALLPSGRALNRRQLLPVIARNRTGRFPPYRRWHRFGVKLDLSVLPSGRENRRTVLARCLLGPDRPRRKPAKPLKNGAAGED